LFIINVDLIFIGKTKPPMYQFVFNIELKFVQT
jgi:hypothetical protein